MLAQGTNTDLTFPVIEDRLYIATRAFCLWLQTIMATRPIGNFRWSPNIDDTEIVITENEPLTLERTNKRPQIIVYRTQASSAGIGVGQYSRPAFGAEEATVTDLISFQIVIQFIAKNGLEAQDLAFTIMRLLPLFKASISRLGRLHKLDGNVNITAETPYTQIVQGSSATEWKQVALVIPVSLQDTVRTDGGDFYGFIRHIELRLSQLSSDGELVEEVVQTV